MGDPGPEVDAAWDRVSDNMMFGISRADVERIGRDPDRSVKMDPAWGAGDDAYMVEVDVFHQIHCLNALRKALITNYDHYWGRHWGWEPPLMFDTHLRHCTSMLLQSLMCHADVEVITHEWHVDQPWPFPNFGVRKQCRDFDRLLAWKEANNLENGEDRYLAHRPPPGTERIPEEPLKRTRLGNATGRRDGQSTKLLKIKNCNA